MRKTFKVYRHSYDYYVLKCPYCSHKFRFNEPFKRKSQTAKCQKCDKRFVISENCLAEDNLGKIWKDALIIKPNHKIEKLNSKIKEEIKKKLSKSSFKSSDKFLKKEPKYIG